LPFFLTSSTYLPLIFLLSVFPLNRAQWRPCVELKRDLLVPCKCIISANYPRSIEMNCDRVIFTHDTVNVLRGQPIVSVSQRNCGHQILPEDLINSGLNLRKLDLSSNSISRLMDRVLQAQSELRELRLADNLLGDNLNPIFSSNEFHGMEELEILDLSRNGLRSIEEGILKGCTNLEELYLDGNNLTVVPTASLKGPRAIRVLSLAGNNIGMFAIYLPDLQINFSLLISSADDCIDETVKFPSRSDKWLKIIVNDGDYFF